MTVVEKISIIVPIYNIEKYLERCLKSLINQTYQNIEVILVNDGSKDKSLAICEAYAKKDNRIKVIDKVNEGVAIARNTGIEATTGAYIAFMDPDDWVEPDMYEALYNQIKKFDSPVCLCDYYKDTKKKSSSQCFGFKDEVLRNSEIIDKLVNNMIGISDLLSRYVWIMGCVWRGLFKKEFLDRQELRFAPGITIMEDLVFMVQTLLKCDSVAIKHKALYHYVQNPSSTLHTYNSRFWEDQIKVYELLEKTLIEANLEEEMRSRLDIRYIGMVLSAIKNEAYLNKETDFKTAMIHIKQICQDENLRFVLERIKPIQVAERTERVVTKKKSKKVPTQNTKVIKNKKLRVISKEKQCAKKKSIRQKKGRRSADQRRLLKKEILDET